VRAETGHHEVKCGGGHRPGALTSRVDSIMLALGLNDGGEDFRLFVAQRECKD